MQLLRGRTTGITTLAISPDSRFVVAVGWGCGCDIWDINEAKPKARWLSMGVGITHRVAFRTSTDLIGFDGSHWCRHDLAAGSRVTLMWPPTDGIIHPSGELLKTVTYDTVQAGVSRKAHLSTLRLTGDDLDTIALAEYVLDRPTLLCFNPAGGRYLVIERFPVDYSSQYHLRDTVTDELVATFRESRRMRPAVGDPHQWAFSPDGRRLFAVSDHDIAVYDCQAGGPPLLELPVGAVPFIALAVHPGGRVVATVEDHRTVTLRDAGTLQPLRSYDFAMPKVTCVAFTPDGTRCVVGNSRGKVLLFDVE